MIFSRLKNLLKKQEKTIIKVGYFNGSEENLLPSIAFWNEFGTYNAPPRPFLRNTASQHRKKWAKNYNRQSPKETAFQMEEDLRKTIEAGDFIANAPITIYGGWMKNKKSGKPFYVKGKGEGKPPLTDTGRLANAIEIRIEVEK